MNARFLALTTRIVVGILWLLVPHLALPQKTFSHLTTLAGNGIAAYSGDGGLATSAALNAPTAVTRGSGGNFFIVDMGNNMVRKVNTSGVISRFAGNLPPVGYSGDGGPATSAKFFTPFGVAVDGSGNVYIADNNNYRVRKVNTSGIINTFAGNGTKGYSGDGGPATQAMVKNVQHLAFHGTSLFISDTWNHRIRKVSSSGIITTVAGNGSCAYTGDGGPATSASLCYPAQVAFDSAGNMYIADNGNAVIRKVNTSGIITTVVIPPLNVAPWGVALDSLGDIYFHGSSGVNVYEYSPATGNTIVVAGIDSCQGYVAQGSPTSVSLCDTNELWVDSSNNLYITDKGHNVISKGVLI